MRNRFNSSIKEDGVINKPRFCKQFCRKSHREVRDCRQICKRLHNWLLAHVFDTTNFY
jgi:hypothetical protein